MGNLIPCCSHLQYAIDDPDVPIVYSSKFREVGIRVLDGGSSYIVIKHCPWCENRLPESLRDEWFATLERMNIDPDGELIPEQFKNELWYNEPK